MKNDEVLVDFKDFFKSSHIQKSVNNDLDFDTTVPQSPELFLSPISYHLFPSPTSQTLFPPPFSLPYPPLSPAVAPSPFQGQL